MHHLQTRDRDVACTNFNDMRLKAPVNDGPAFPYNRQGFIDNDMLPVGLTAKDPNLVMGGCLPHSLVDGRERMSWPNLKQAGRGWEESSPYKNTNYDNIN